MTRHRTLILAAGMAGAALVPATARADTIVYTDQGNVWAATADGATARPFTADGSPTLPAPGDASAFGKLVGPYSSASADDAGRVLAVRATRQADGSDRGTFVLLGPDRVVRSTRPARLPTCSGARTGPFGARISPSGRAVVFSTTCANFGGGTSGARSLLALNHVDQDEPADPAASLGLTAPTWAGDRLVVDGGNGTFVQPDVPQAPFTGDFVSWFTGGAGGTAGRLDLARDGSRAVVEIEQASGYEAYVIAPAGPPPNPDAEILCRVPAAGGRALDATMSPHGDRLAFRDTEALKVLTLGALGPSGDGAIPVCPGSVRTISPTGTFASWTPADILPPAAGRPPEPPNGGATPAGPAQPSGPKGGPVAPALQVRSRSLKRARRSGLKLRLAQAPAKPVTVTVRLKGKLLGRAKVKAGRRDVTVKLKPRLLRGLKQAKVTITGVGPALTVTLR